ncbi:MAG: hypothetical protein JNK46_05630 [Methylobacteriaceae bacterium]|nr:hypothetical protein [Methylobacteriaceae bacterium]
MTLALRIVLGFFGAILLLPGLCSAGFLLATLPQLLTGRNLGDFVMLGALWAVGFGIAFGGFLLLRKAVRWR